MLHLLALMAAPAGQQSPYSKYFLIAQIVVIGGGFWFLMIRPQKKEQTRLKDMLDNLKKGDEVVTAGGIIGTVVFLRDDRVTIRSDESTKIVIQRSRIIRVLNADTAATTS